MMRIGRLYQWRMKRNELGWRKDEVRLMNDIVRMWNNGIMRLWDYEIKENSRARFITANLTLPQSLAIAPCGDYACCKDSRQFFAFGDKCAKLARWHVRRFTYDLEPDTGFNSH